MIGFWASCLVSIGDVGLAERAAAVIINFITFSGLHRIRGP